MKQYLNYFKKNLNKKARFTIHNVKNFKRYTKVYISAGLSLVIVGGVVGVITGLMVGMNEKEDPRDLVQFVQGVPPKTYNWIPNFTVQTATPASRLMSGLLRPRSPSFDNIEKINNWLATAKAKKSKFEIAGKQFDLSKREDYESIKKVIAMQIKQRPKGVPEDYGLLGFPKLHIKNSNGGTYNPGRVITDSFALDGAKDLTIYKKGELLLQNGSINDNGLAYEFTLRDNFVWNDGVKVKPDDFVYQVASVLNSNLATLRVLKTAGDASKLEKNAAADAAFKKKVQDLVEKNKEKTKKVLEIYKATKGSYPKAYQKAGILLQNLNLPPTLFHVITANANISQVSAKKDVNAFISPWDRVTPDKLMNFCASDDLDRTATMWDNQDLKFFDGRKFRFYDNVGDLCDSFSLFSKKGENKILFKMSKDFDTYWLFELIGASVLFYPARKDFLAKLAVEHKDTSEMFPNEVNHILGADYYARDPKSYLGNGPFEVLNMGKTFKMIRNEKWHSKEYVIPNSYTLKYVSASAANAITLNFIRGTTGTTGITNEWYNVFRRKKALADKASLELTNVGSTYSWSVNLFAPEFTNEYFRTPIGKKISWGDEMDAKYPDKTIVKEYKLIDGIKCEPQVNSKLYYPSLSIDNYICGLPPKFKDFANAFRRFFSVTYNSGAAIANIGDSGNPDPYTFTPETLTPWGMTYDQFDEEFVKTTAIAMKYQNDHPIRLADSKYDNSFRAKTGGNSISADKRAESSIYGNSQYDKNSWDWKGLRKVGFSYETVKNRAPSKDLVAPDPITGVPTKVGLTPSFDFQKAKQMWEGIKSKFPEYTKKKYVFFVPSMRATSWVRLALLDYWNVNLRAITGDQVKMDVEPDENYFDTQEYFAQAGGLSCGQPANEQSEEYSLFDADGTPKSNCLRNPAITFTGWGYDYSDPKNSLATFGGGMNTVSLTAEQIPRHIFQYWLDNIESIINEDEKNKKITSDEAQKFRTNIEKHLNALIRPGSKYTFMDSLQGQEMKDAAGNKVPILDSMSAYSRNKIIAQFEAWRIREGLSIPLMLWSRKPLATRLANDIMFNSIMYRDNAYNCDVSEGDRTFKRYYIDKNGAEQSYTFIAPNCMDSRIISYLSQKNEVRALKD